jgi:hypothetical protein
MPIIKIVRRDDDSATGNRNLLAWPLEPSEAPSVELNIFKGGISKRRVDFIDIVSRDQI